MKLNKIKIQILLDTNKMEFSLSFLILQFISLFYAWLFVKK